MARSLAFVANLKQEIYCTCWMWAYLCELHRYVARVFRLATRHSHICAGLFSTSQFDDYTHEAYRSYIGDKQRRSVPVDENDPVGYFEISATETTAVVKLQVPRAGRFVSVSTCTLFAVPSLWL